MLEDSLGMGLRHSKHLPSRHLDGHETSSFRCHLRHFEEVNSCFSMVWRVFSANNLCSHSVMHLKPGNTQLSVVKKFDPGVCRVF